MAIVERLETILKQSTLTFEEQRAFLLGLGYLSAEEQEEFALIIEENGELLYPLYINFKVKLRGMKEGDTEWSAIVEKEIEEFETLLGDRK